MPIQKTFNKTDGTSGDYWRLETFGIRIATNDCVITAALYKSANDFSNGKTAMRTTTAVLPLATFTNQQLTTIKNVVEAALVGGAQVEFSGGVIV